MLQFTSIMIGTNNLEAMITFYEQVFGKKPDWSDGDYVGFGSKDFHLVIGTHSEIKSVNKEPARILINFTTTEVQAEFDRLKKLGAKVIAAPYAMDGSDKAEIATLADPDGNYLQLIIPME